MGAINLLNIPGKWTRSSFHVVWGVGRMEATGSTAFATDALFRPIPWYADNAHRFCAVGALLKSAKSYGLSLSESIAVTSQLVIEIRPDSHLRDISECEGLSAVLNAMRDWLIANNKERVSTCVTNSR